VLPAGPPESASTPALETLRQHLSHSPAPLTRGCELGILVRTGAGTKAEGVSVGAYLA
jgi:hypothetical protein